MELGFRETAVKAKGDGDKSSGVRGEGIRAGEGEERWEEKERKERLGFLVEARVGKRRRRRRRRRGS